MLLMRKAEKEDIPEIAKLYRSVIGMPGCLWNEYYPSEVEICADIGAESLYLGVMEGELACAVSVVPENELDDESAWQIQGENVREVARIVVAPKYQGRGLAAEALKVVMEEMQSGGCRAVHLLVAKSNPAAISTYRKLGFRFLGECFRYGHDYFLCEKELQ